MVTNGNKVHCAGRKRNQHCLRRPSKRWLYLPKGNQYNMYIILMYFLFLCLKEMYCSGCGQAEYKIGDECCPLCSAGSRVYRHCTAYTSTSCVPCERSTFTDRPNGAEQCSHCTVCDQALGLKTVKECTPSSDTVCGVLEGHYCIDADADADEGGCRAAQKHTACTPGQFIKRPGTGSGDAVCEDCPANTYSNGSSTYCKPHTACTPGQFISQTGSESTDTLCGECPENLYSNGPSKFCTPHTDCFSKVRYTIQRGDHTSDSECGRSFIAPVLVLVLFTLVLTSVIVLLRCKIQKINDPG